MKRIGTILVSFVLSLTIVYLGAGTVIVECLRSNTVTVGVLEDDCCKGDKCCQEKRTCMKTTVVRLQPTVVCKQLCKVEKPALSLLPQLLGNDVAHFLRAEQLPQMQYVPRATHAPPRLYLAFIRVLVI